MCPHRGKPLPTVLLRRVWEEVARGNACQQSTHKASHHHKQVSGCKFYELA
jgi:hypothetical protein